MTERPTFQEAGLGATGLIFGRNVWQREHDESLKRRASARGASAFGVTDAVHVSAPR